MPEIEGGGRVGEGSEKASVLSAGFVVFEKRRSELNMIGV